MSKDHLKDMFESYLQFLATTPGVEIKESSSTDTSGRIIYTQGGIEFLQTVQVLNDKRTPAQRAEEEGREFEGGPDIEAHPVPVHVTIVCEEDDKHERSSN